MAEKDVDVNGDKGRRWNTFSTLSLQLEGCHGASIIYYLTTLHDNSTSYSHLPTYE